MTKSREQLRNDALKDCLRIHLSKAVVDAGIRRYQDEIIFTAAFLHGVKVCCAGFRAFEKLGALPDDLIKAASELRDDLAREGGLFAKKPHPETTEG